MFKLSKLEALALVFALSLLVLAPAVPAQGGDTGLEPGGESGLVQQEEDPPPPPDDGDKDFDEWDSDVLNLTSPETTPGPSSVPSWTPELWLEVLRDWLGMERR